MIYFCVYTIQPGFLFRILHSSIVTEKYSILKTIFTAKLLHSHIDFFVNNSTTIKNCQSFPTGISENKEEFPNFEKTVPTATFPDGFEINTLFRNRNCIIFKMKTVLLFVVFCFVTTIFADELSKINDLRRKFAKDNGIPNMWALVSSPEGLHFLFGNHRDTARGCWISPNPFHAQPNQALTGFTTSPSEERTGQSSIGTCSNDSIHTRKPMLLWWPPKSSNGRKELLIFWNTWIQFKLKLHVLINGVILSRQISNWQFAIKECACLDHSKFLK